MNRKRGIQHTQIQTSLPIYRDGPSWGIFISRSPGQAGDVPLHSWSEKTRRNNTTGDNLRLINLPEICEILKVALVTCWKHSLLSSEFPLSSFRLPHTFLKNLSKPLFPSSFSDRAEIAMRTSCVRANRTTLAMYITKQM